MINVEKLKKEIEVFEIQDLAEIIRTEPLIAGKSFTLSFNKKQYEELKNCMLEIAKKTLDLAELEIKFLMENDNNIAKIIDIKKDKELKELLKILF